MHRLVAILLLGGALLVANGVQAPAAPPRGEPDATAPTIEQAVPVMSAVNAEVTRLRQRVAEPATFPKPERDPFRFGRRIEPTPVAPDVEPAPAIVEPPVELPRLVALVETRTAAGLAWRAVLSLGDGIDVLSAGERIGRFTLRSVSSGAVELVDAVTGRAHLIALR